MSVEGADVPVTVASSVFLTMSSFTERNAASLATLAYSSATESKMAFRAPSVAYSFRLPLGSECADDAAPLEYPASLRGS